MEANYVRAKIIQLHSNSLFVAHLAQPKIFFHFAMPKTITNSEDDPAVLVDVMLDLNKKIRTAKGSREKQIQRQIKKTDREIDDLVVRLRSPNIV